MKVSALTIYPVKSMAGVSVQSVSLQKAGLTGDRRFMVVKPDGKFVTGRTHHQITRIFPSFDGETLTLSHGEAGSISVNVSELADCYMDTSVWKTDVQGQYCGTELDEWVSSILGDTVHLLYFGPKSARLVEGEAGTEVGFADGFPLLVAGENSLNDLNSRLDVPVSMANFRPNIVIEDSEAFAEDSWRRIRIGAVEVELVKLCSRCIFTTVNPETGARDTGSDPLKTLSQYRKNSDGVMFGQNGMPVQLGEISVGDEVEVLETQGAPVFQS